MKHTFQIQSTLSKSEWLCSYSATLSNDKKNVRQIDVLKLAGNEPPKMLSNIIEEVFRSSLIPSSRVLKDFDVMKDQKNQIIFLKEYHQGKSLRDIIEKAKQQKKPLPLYFIFSVFHELCLTLHETHRFLLPDGNTVEIVHGGVKPENIIITPTGKIRMTQFGVSRNALYHSLAVNAYSNFYLSPEQIEMGFQNFPNYQIIDHFSDIFQLGLVLYEMITLRLPFQGRNPQEQLQMIQSGQFIKPSVYFPEFPQRIDQMILYCVQYQKKSRYPSFEHILAHLRELETLFDTDFGNKHVISYIKTLEPPITLTSENGSPFEKITKASVAVLNSSNLSSITYFFKLKLLQLKESAFYHNKILRFASFGSVLFLIGAVVAVFLIKPLNIEALFDTFRNPTIDVPEKHRLINEQFSLSQIITKPAGAKIFLNQKPVGITPETLFLQKTQDAYTLELVKTGYEKTTFHFQIGGQNVLPIEKTLSKQMGVVNISSVPSEAMVIIDNQAQGVTPLKIESLSVLSTSKLALFFPGHEFWEYDLNFSGSTKRELSPQLREGNSGALIQINTFPAGAEILFQNNVIGKSSPKSFFHFETGEYFITLRNTAIGFERDFLLSVPKSGIKKYFFSLLDE